MQKWLLNISFQSKEEGTLAKCWTKIMWDKGNRGWYTLERGPWEDPADIYWSQAKKSRFLVEESRTWQNSTIIFWWRRLKHLQLMLLVWPSRPMATHIKMGGKHLKHVNLWHACGGINSSFVSSAQDKNCSCFVSFSFFAHSQKIHQSNLVLTFDKIILSKKKTFLPKSRQWRH